MMCALQAERAREAADKLARLRGAAARAALLGKKPLVVGGVGSKGAMMAKLTGTIRRNSATTGTAAVAAAPAAASFVPQAGSGLAQSPPVVQESPALGMHRIHIEAPSTTEIGTRVLHLDESSRLQWEWLKRSSHGAVAILALRRVMHGTLVVGFISALIVVNTVVLGLDKYPLWDDELVCARA